MQGVKDTTPPCSVAGCAKRGRHRGWCAAHYRRFRLYGNPLAPMQRAPNGAGSINDSGYRVLCGKREHIGIAERALGKPLPKGAIVHHANGIRSDNRPANLVVCPSQSYHSLLHLRIRAQVAGVPLDWRKCSLCGAFDSPDQLVKHAGRESVYHRRCHAAYQKARKESAAPRRDPVSDLIGGICGGVEAPEPESDGSDDGLCTRFYPSVEGEAL